MKSDRMPWSVDAERGLLAAIMLEPGVLEQIRSRPEHFQGFLERSVFQAIVELRDVGADVTDPITLAECVAKNGLQCSPSDISSLALATLTAQTAPAHDVIIQRHAMTRAVLDALGGVEERWRMGLAEGEELFAESLAALASIDRGTLSEPVTVGDIVRERLREIADTIDRRAAGEELEIGITTGLPVLDEMLGGGWGSGVFHVLAGRPSMGKSACLLAFADAASVAGYGVHVFSLEDKRAAYASRLLSRHGELRLADVRTARLGPVAMRAMLQAGVKLVERKRWLYTDRQSMRGRTWQAVVDEVRIHRKRNDTDLVIIDYANIVHATRRHQDRKEELAEVINGLADAADADDLAYVVGAQLNRNLEKRDDKRPRLSDIKDSSTLDDRGKVIIGLHRPSHYSDEPVEGKDYPRGGQAPTQEEYQSTLWLDVLKQNQGPEGSVRARWIGERAAAVPWDD